MQLPSKSSSHPPRPSDLSHGFPWDVSIMRRDGGLALLLMADGWPSERTSHLHDERVGRMIEGDVQGPSLFNATGTTFIITCQQPSFATRESSSGFHAHWQEVPMTNRLQGCREHESGHSKEWHHLKGFFVFVICFAVCLFFPVFLWTFWMFCKKMKNAPNSYVHHYIHVHPGVQWTTINHPQNVQSRFI